ncbi:Chromosome partition protein Smc [Candidatus Gugararchaeum adminiculabundum]|nr:Chromosome partition protein Smc [Candidatus Gugararchaeum adminiculabundum]
MATKSVQQEAASVPKEDSLDDELMEETAEASGAKAEAQAGAGIAAAGGNESMGSGAGENSGGANSKRGQMQIARVRMRGFKSFRSADVKLTSGFMCLAGPNGSGKSNICDAIRFAFGETVLSNLRVKRVADLITQGSDKAEITVYLEGKNGKHEIKRAIRGDGKTAYKFDGRTCTRRAVIDNIRPYGFEPTAHNVIAQGQVQKIVDMHPKERREILDAVSGISEFEDKKKEAMSKLGAVDQKINDAYIVLKEREGALTELAKQKEDALKHREVFEEVKKLKGSVIFHELNAVDKKHTQVAERYIALKKDTDTLSKDIEVLQGKINELSVKKEEVVRKINEKGKNEKTAGELADLRAQIGIDKSSIEQKKGQIDKNKIRIDALAVELKELEEKAAGSIREVANLKKKLEGTQKEIEAFESEHKELLGNAKKKAQEIGRMKKGLAEVSEAHAKMKETVSRLEM